MHFFIKLTAHITWKYWKKMTYEKTHKYFNKYLFILKSWVHNHYIVKYTLPMSVYVSKNMLNWK